MTLAVNDAMARVVKLHRKNPHAVALGRLGGSVCSPAKKAAAKINGAKGGRPKGSSKELSDGARG